MKQSNGEEEQGEQRAPGVETIESKQKLEEEEKVDVIEDIWNANPDLFIDT